MAQFDVFLSHNSKDKVSMRVLNDVLQRAGFSTWFDEQNLVPGQPWVDGIEHGLKNSKMVLIAVGKSGLGPWETPEMRAALIQMVRHNTSVVPLFLPEAPEQIELPLFLQTLTWIDCRNGFESLPDKIRKSLDQTNSSTANSNSRPIQNPSPKRGEHPFKDSFIGSFFSSLPASAKAVVFLPILPILAGLQPPWDATSRIQEVISIGVLTLFIEVIALMAGYSLIKRITPAQIRCLLQCSLVATVISFLVYLGSFIFFTEVQPDTNGRLIAGFIYSIEYKQLLEAYDGDSRQVKMDLLHDPMRIYAPWSVWSAYCLVIVSWLVFFSSLTLYLSSFFRTQKVDEHLAKDQALVVLQLSQATRHQLQNGGIETVGDLCALNDRQLRLLTKDSALTFREVVEALNQYGIPLRDSP